MRRRHSIFIFLLSLSFLVGIPAFAYRAPVDAPIVDHFRPPLSEYGPGNRGIDYEAVPGAPVVASAAGVVSFAGKVGNDLFVVITHRDGLRTTYGYLQSLLVTFEQQVEAGQVVGTASGNLHFGVRREETYIDPEELLENQKAHLIPVHRP